MSSSKCPDNIFVNLTLSNSTNQPYAPAVTNQAFNEALCDEPMDYEMALESFQVPLQSLPLFIMGTDLEVGVCEIPRPETATPPGTFPNETTGTATTVVYTSIFQYDTTENQVFGYNHFLEMLNTALKKSWTDESSPGGAMNQPYFFWDETRGLIKLAMPYAFVNATSVEGFGWTVYWNDPLQARLNSFNVRRNAITGNVRYEVQVVTVDPYDNSIIGLYPFPQGATPSVRDANTVYIISQEYGSFEYLCDVRRIIFTSGTIPLYKEWFPTSTRQYAGTDNPKLGVANPVNILASYILPLDFPGNQRSIIRFRADEYRWNTVISNAPIRNMDVQIYWVDRLNVLRPVQINQKDSVTLTLYFRSKEHIDLQADLKSNQLSGCGRRR